MLERHLHLREPEADRTALAAEEAEPWEIAPLEAVEDRCGR
jgi:hypothetical protein